jgi:hypothetical protein
LGHSDIHTTKIYLKEKHGYGATHQIMKRFLVSNVRNYYIEESDGMFRIKIEWKTFSLVSDLDFHR